MAEKVERPTGQAKCGQTLSADTTIPQNEEIHAIWAYQSSLHMFTSGDLRLQEMTPWLEFWTQTHT